MAAKSTSLLIDELTRCRTALRRCRDLGEQLLALADRDWTHVRAYLPTHADDIVRECDRALQDDLPEDATP